MAEKDNMHKDDRLGNLFGDAMRSARPGGGCPPPEDLAALADGVLSPLEREKIHEHMAVCAHCREVFAMVADEVPDEVMEPAPRQLAGRQRPWTLRRLVPAALAAGIAFAAGYMLMVSPGEKAGGKAVMEVAMNDSRQAAPQAASEPAPVAETDALSKTEEVSSEEGMPELKRADKYAGGLEDSSSGAVLGGSYADTDANEYDMFKNDAALSAGEAGREPETVPADELRYAGARAMKEEPPSGKKMPESQGASGVGKAPVDDSYRAKAAEMADAAPEMERRFEGARPSPAYAPPPPAACSKESATCVVPAEAGGEEGGLMADTSQPVPDKETGKVVSVDMEKKLLVFVPEGSDKEKIVTVEPKYLELIKPGDKVRVYYKPGDTKVATRLKKVTPATIPVGC